MPRPRLRRALRAFLYTFATLCVLWATLIAGPMWLTRIRMTHLLADFQSIRPTQSTWADAQRLMARWGKWGHYDGNCTAESCSYTVLLIDPFDAILYPRQENYEGYLSNPYPFGIPPIAEYIGIRGARFFVVFTVRSGVITSTQTSLSIQGPGNEDTGWRDSYALDLYTQLRTRLHRSYRLPLGRHRWILGGDEQLAEHPEYKVGGPSSCQPCESRELSYTTQLPHADVTRFTSYDLSCITRWHPCAHLGDILPVASTWSSSGDVQAPSEGSALPPCRTDPRALGRDAEIVLEVAPISVKTSEEGRPNLPTIHRERVRSRIVGTLKGRFGTASEITIQPDTGFNGTPNPDPPEHLAPGHRYFVLLDSDYRYEDGPFVVQRCGVLEATPENLRRLSLGIAEDLKYHDVDNPDE